MAIGTAQYNEFLSASIADVEAELQNEVLLPHPTLDLFAEGIKSSSGSTYDVNIVGKVGTTEKSDASGTFNTDADDDLLGRAQYPWAAPIISKARVRWQTLQQVSGKQQLVDLAKVHMDAAVESHRIKIVSQLHALADERADNDLLSLDVIVSDTLPVGGIDPTESGHAYWKSVRRTIPSTGTGSMPINRAFRAVVNDIYAASGGVRPTHIIVGRDVFDEYEDSLDATIRNAMSSSVDTRFQELRFDGLVVRWDPECQEDRAYFLHKPSLRFAACAGNFMKTQKVQPITGTLDEVTPLASLLQLATTSRRKNGLLIRT